MNPKPYSPSLIRANKQVHKPDLKAIIGLKCSQSLPEVHVQTSGDVVQTIEINCVCGEKIVLECQYK